MLQYDSSVSASMKCRQVESDGTEAEQKLLGRFSILYFRVVRTSHFALLGKLHETAACYYYFLKPERRRASTRSVIFHETLEIDQHCDHRHLCSPTDTFKLDPSTT
jgi:hypothetical protein